MALNSGKVSSVSASGVAVATARPLSGGRNIAVARAAPVEETAFAPQIGVSDNSLYRYDDPGSFSDRRDNPKRSPTPFINRLTSGFQSNNGTVADPSNESFQLILRRGIGLYEEMLRVTGATAFSRPGAVIDYVL